MEYGPTPTQRVFSKQSFWLFTLAFFIASAPVAIVYLGEILLESDTPNMGDPFDEVPYPKTLGLHNVIELNFYCLPMWFLGAILAVFPAAYWAFSATSQRFIRFYGLSIAIAISISILPPLLFGTFSSLHLYLSLGHVLAITMLNSIYWCKLHDQKIW